MIVNGPSTNDSRCRRKPCWIERCTPDEKNAASFRMRCAASPMKIRDALRHLVDQSPMILMSMRDDETEQRRVLVAQPGHVRQRNEFVSKRVQRPANVENNPRPG